MTIGASLTASTGIAAAGNPAIRMAYGRQNWDWRNVPAAPTEERANRVTLHRQHDEAESDHRPTDRHVGSVEGASEHQPSLRLLGDLQTDQFRRRSGYRASGVHPDRRVRPEREGVEPDGVKRSYRANEISVRASLNVDPSGFVCTRVLVIRTDQQRAVVARGEVKPGARFDAVFGRPLLGQ